ncbi:hypothetical protein SAMN04487983_100369 [Streptomyces sp. yr375]|uniref:hypothetical protein n=1 Tax=Streptomyces sp. yr375 TaxID=1761906 RepID=UPI0008C00639|nr:hypothetical protein [Streptomyces sp. yr375]SEQ10240.1 hypothetical protein SAMN04487983_100369 [Streptomyces sp. yr375]
MRKKTAAVLACAAALVALGSPPASAAGETATNKRTQYIAKYPATNAHSCINRRIYLASDWYTWRLTGLETGAADRSIYLASGWYAWQDCLDYLGPGSYDQDSSLDPENPAYDTVRFSVFDYSVGRDYYWGSSLTPS